MSASNENQSAARSRDRSSRKERVPLGVARTRLSIDESAKDPNYNYRWITDKPGRLDSAQSGGYEFAPEQVKVGQDVKDGNSDVGSRVSRVVGTNSDGTPQRGYLMRIPKEYFEADQAEKQRKVDDIDAAIKRGTANQRGADDNRYVPKGGINIRTAKVRVVEPPSGE